MGPKKAIWIAIVSLLIALAGLISLYLASYFSSDLLVKMQIGAILYLALLSVGIFYQNNKEKIAKHLHPRYRIIVNNFGYLVFVLFALDLVITLFTYWVLTHSIYLPMISASAAAVGLYFANDVFRQL
jgi:hypothetical protein